mmetsp:Transcript_4447/g.8932  ORF Transcript_4447/g.8932 Transcript_4447/m.8932 type:complete len:266 (+) Transcript_4447:52-849(+)|eukprot:CAMPEP_0181295034 /NCGR_PEP_ID=MMETSP1101-20121128/3923_1 /TAXON_ID=46948 /ORGANISM="Rhodomonas abbreviata, Strain Caron Lab Isolate" /LENGTH=265 /DNA_ID=CAMNT_0023399741 /DNA_START=45 /DNA_END=842 /DNA_ORIENTATION=+
MVARTVDSASRVLQEGKGDNIIFREKVLKDPAPVPDKIPLKTVPFKSRKDLHLLRKLFHALAGIAMAFVYEYILSREQTLIIFGGIFAFLLVGEILRFNFPNSPITRFTLWLLQLLARTYEMKHMTGMIYFVTGVLICVGLLPKKVAVLSILFLAIGDPCASTCGIQLGYLGPKFRNGKSLMGFVGGFLSCAITTYVYFFQETGPSTSLFAVSLLGGFAGGVTELLCGRVVEGTGGPIDIDDNLAVPVGSGFLFYAGLQYFPSFI